MTATITTAKNLFESKLRPEAAIYRHVINAGDPWIYEIKKGQFVRIVDLHAFLQSIKPEAESFKKHQQAAFEAERERWAAAGQAEYLEPPEAPGPAAEADVPDGCSPVRSPIAASVWNVAVATGQRVEAGQKLMVLEAMKTEIAVTAPRAGIVESLACAAGALVWAGQILLLLRAEATA